MRIRNVESEYSHWIYLGDTAPSRAAHTDTNTEQQNSGDDSRETRG
jgi:hypothetical protein